MKVENLLRISKDLLKMMSENDIKMTDYKCVDMYAEYEMARKRGEKDVVVIMGLSEKYGVSESTIKRIIWRFEKSI